MIFSPSSKNAPLLSMHYLQYIQFIVPQIVYEDPFNIFIHFLVPVWGQCVNNLGRINFKEDGCHTTGA